jgi:hypothetical protein
MTYSDTTDCGSKGKSFKKEFRSSGVQEFRSSGVQEFRSSGVQEFKARISAKQEFKTNATD